MAQDFGEKVATAFVLWVVEKLVRRIVLDDLALVHEDHAVGHGAGKSHLMRDTQPAHA